MFIFYPISFLGDKVPVFRERGFWSHEMPAWVKSPQLAAEPIPGTKWERVLGSASAGVPARGAPGTALAWLRSKGGVQSALGFLGL